MNKVSVLLFLVMLIGSSTLAQTQEPQAPVGTKSSANTVQTKVDPAKAADIQKLMELMGAKALMLQIIGGMEGNIKPLMTSALPHGEYRAKLVDLFFDKFHSKLDSQKLIDLAVPVYDKYYTAEEVKALIRFYQTPLGQKVVTVLPKLTNELQSAGRSWGETLGRESMQEVLAEHPDLAKALEDAKTASQPK